MQSASGTYVLYIPTRDTCVLFPLQENLNLPCRHAEAGDTRQCNARAGTRYRPLFKLRLLHLDPPVFRNTPVSREV